MTLLYTENQRISNLVKREYGLDVSYCLVDIAYNDVAHDFVIGELVASDGTVPAAAANVYGVVVRDVSAPATTDTLVQVLFRGPASVSKNGIDYGALVVADVDAKLESLGIQVLDAV